jgi:hypothetical protein
MIESCFAGRERSRWFASGQVSPAAPLTIMLGRKTRGTNVCLYGFDVSLDLNIIR